MTSKAKRTYGSRAATLASKSSSPPSELASSPPNVKRKRTLVEQLSFHNAPVAKRLRLSKVSTQSSKKKDKGTRKQLTQLHFALETSVLRTCALCDLTYTRGAPDDESLHRSHCARVQRALEWGKEEERECVKANVEEVVSDIRLRNGMRGRIVCFRAEVGGKIGAKVCSSLKTVGSLQLTPYMSVECVT